MTIREIAEILEPSDIESAAGFLQVMFQILRTIEQGEPATFEGCCASCLEWMKTYGKPSPDSIQLWLNDLGDFANKNIPDEVVSYSLDVDDDN